MVHYNEYVAGWLDGSIGDFLTELPRSSESVAYALITCLDSSFDPASLLRKNSSLRSAMNGVKTLKKSVIVPLKLLQRAGLRDQLFVGFDEVWFFPTDQIEPKPDSTSIVGPNRIDQRTLDKLGSWMGANACSLALGDGAGLNIIVKAHGLVKYVIGHSLSQPEPTFQMSKLWVEDEEKKLSKTNARARTR